MSIFFTNGIRSIGNLISRDLLFLSLPELEEEDAVDGEMVNPSFFGVSSWMEETAREWGKAHGCALFQGLESRHVKKRCDFDVEEFLHLNRLGEE